MSVSAGGIGGGFGTSFGDGGALTVARAVPVAGQVVRVTFTTTPSARSAAGGTDSLNPANYAVTVDAGQATAPTVVGTSGVLVAGPALGVGTSVGNLAERAVDVHVDRQLIFGVVYRVAARNILDASGAPMGFPREAPFPGITKLATVKRPGRNQDLVDIANPPVLGAWQVDDSSDVAVEDPAVGTRKRILRRIVTPRGAFSFLPGYGGRVKIKGIAGPADMTEFKDDLQQQVLQEPDVVAATTAVSIAATGILTVEVRAKTRRGAFLTLTHKFSADTGVLIG